jgi:hypothetical protein
MLSDSATLLRHNTTKRLPTPGIKQILGYANVKGLSLLPALERILKIYPSLKSFFMSGTKCPEVLKQLFENSETELWLIFAHSQASLFMTQLK